MKLSLTLCSTLAIVALAASQDSPKHDYVPNSETAVVIAEAVLIPVYGKKHIESERPFRATLKDDVWTVAGTLYCADGKPQTDTPPTCDGGVAVVQISKIDARVISMMHYK
jgi:NTF2 fold immunity protein